MKMSKQLSQLADERKRQDHERKYQAQKEQMEIAKGIADGIVKSMFPKVLLLARETAEKGEKVFFLSRDSFPELYDNQEVFKLLHPWLKKKGLILHKNYHGEFYIDFRPWHERIFDCLPGVLMILIILISAFIVWFCGRR